MSLYGVLTRDETSLLRERNLPALDARFLIDSHESLRNLLHMLANCSHRFGGQIHQVRGEGGFPEDCSCMKAAREITRRT